jgi:hypothetical protein
VNARVANQPLLMVDSDPRRPAATCVGVYKLDADIMASLRMCTETDCLLQSILRVSVAEPRPATGDNFPDVFGRYHVFEDGVQFTPYFPFERGLSYRASFDPRPLGRTEFTDVATLEFSLPKEPSALPPVVQHIFPSSHRLPENLLRFYICFSNSMQRGRAEAEISLLGPDGEPAPDALYRAPIELWDRSMRYLTILLDPGRLKRGVGPNRELGPPLKTGQMYTLVVGAGMTDESGSRLPETVCKRFRVFDAVREPIAIEQWKIVPPQTNSRQPLILTFPRPLDWALLSQTITIASTCEQSIDGQMVIDQCETQWSLTPTSPWAAGSYHIRVASSLEDVCGNSVVAAFDRPLRSDSGLASEVGSRSIPLHLV